MNLTIEIKAKPEKFHELYQTLQSLLPTMRAEDGCLESRIYRNVDDGEVFFLSVERFSGSSLRNGGLQSPNAGNP